MALNDVGSFDETLPGADDWDMWIRIAAGYAVLGCRRVLVEIREHGSNQGKRLDRMYDVTRRVIQKHQALHADCAECDAASRRATRQLALDYYVKSCDRSRELWRSGQPFAALATRLKGTIRHPAAVARLPVRAAQSLGISGAAST